VRGLSLLLAALAWFCSGWALLVGVVWGLGLKCDDSCSSSEGWRGDPDAWQWYGVAGLGVLTFICGAALFVFVWRRRPLLATGAVIVGFASAAFLTGVFSTPWIDHLDRRSPAELLLMTASAFAPVLAVLLTPPRTRNAGGG
jgi:hypothetical protein